MKKYLPVGIENVDITGGFWRARQELNRDVSLPAVRDRFMDTGRFDAFNMDWTDQKSYKPHFFWDSDIAKWIESAAYILKKRDDPELVAVIDGVVDLIEKHQQPDGYFNIYFTVVAPGKRFTNRSYHELYCAGHLTEAAVAYYEATGKQRFLNCMRKYIDLIEKVFIIDKSAAFASPGHEELELALIKLARCTGERRYAEMSKHFVDVRGTAEDTYDDKCTDYFNQNYNRSNMQAHLPVREQYTAEGHSVRACYLYSAMADNVYEFDDERLLQNCKAIFDNIVGRRMYITGGIGSSNRGEAFTVDYDLPNDSAYAESCAAISLAFFARRMSLLEADSVYADTVERIMYNGFLSSTSLDGKKFFYVNPLALYPERIKRNSSMLKDNEISAITQRVEVFSCSCCPPNVTRFVASLGEYLYTHDDNCLFVHQYMQSEASFDLAGRKVSITQTTDYPHSGDIEIELRGAKGKKIALRIPSWADEYTLSGKYELKKGYAYIDCAEDCLKITLKLAMPVKYTRAHPSVIADAGKAAVTRGPIVFCAEAVDNGGALSALRLSPEPCAEVGRDEKLGVDTVTVNALRRLDEGKLYSSAEPKLTPVRLKLIPYYAFANRGESEMCVFIDA